MLRQLCVRSRSCAPFAKRRLFGYPLTPSYALSRLQRQAEDMERDMDRWMGSSFFARPDWPSAFRPFRMENPFELESYRLTHPIVEEDGKQLFKLQFDVRRFKPDEVSITTNAKDRLLVVEAKHEDEHSKFAFTRKVSIPEGADVNQMTCRCDEDGILTVRAPYTVPESEQKKITEPRQAKDIEIKRE